MKIVDAAEMRRVQLFQPALNALLDGGGHGSGGHDEQQRHGRDLLYGCWAKMVGRRYRTSSQGASWSGKAWDKQAIYTACFTVHT